MSKLSSTALFTLGIITAGSAHAGGVSVPEIDGGMATLALGLTVALVALLKDRRKH